jgi:predicted nucleotidyltransferase
VISAGDVLRAARRRAGLSQVQLGQAAGVSQSVVSAYESGARQPSVPMLERLVGATGFDLELRLVRRRPRPLALGPLGQRLMRNRRRVQQISARHGLTNVRVFGSVARGQERPGSDVDLLVDVAPGVGLFELGRCQAELESMLGARVDLVPTVDLKADVATEALSEARAL